MRRGEPSDETWGDVPYEDRVHVGSWTAPSVDLNLNLVFFDTSVTSPAPKFLRGGIENTHLYHNSTLALDADPARSAGYYQHLHDDWDLYRPFKRQLVNTAVCSFAAAEPAVLLAQRVQLGLQPIAVGCQRLDRRRVSVGLLPGRRFFLLDSGLGSLCRCPRVLRLSGARHTVLPLGRQLQDPFLCRPARFGPFDLFLAGGRQRPQRPISLQLDP